MVGGVLDFFQSNGENNLYIPSKTGDSVMHLAAGVGVPVDRCKFGMFINSYFPIVSSTC